MIGVGAGKAFSELNAFDRALMNAGVENYNLVKISSILPKGAEITNKVTIEPGSLLPIAYTCLISTPCIKKAEMSAAVAVGVPKNPELVGVIMEWSGYESEEIARRNVINMLKTAMNDRQINEYKIKYKSIADFTSDSDYVCVFACVSIMEETITP